MSIVPLFGPRFGAVFAIRAVDPKQQGVERTVRNFQHLATGMGLNFPVTAVVSNYVDPRVLTCAILPFKVGDTGQLLIACHKRFEEAFRKALVQLGHLFTAWTQAVRNPVAFDAPEVVLDAPDVKPATELADAEEDVVVFSLQPREPTGAEKEDYTPKHPEHNFLNDLVVGYLGAFQNLSRTLLARVEGVHTDVPMLLTHKGDMLLACLDKDKGPFKDFLELLGDSVYPGKLESAGVEDNVSFQVTELPANRAITPEMLQETLYDAAERHGYAQDRSDIDTHVVRMGFPSPGEGRFRSPGDD